MMKNFKRLLIFSPWCALKGTSPGPLGSRPAMAVAFLLLSVTGCRQDSFQREIVIKNPLDIDRKSETIAIPAEQLRKLEKEFGVENLLVREAGNKEYLVRQLIDYDQDGKTDELLFQADINASEEKRFIIEGKEGGALLQPENKVATYSRFVPERTDDYTWENDRVAFRTYGPRAQHMVEEGEPGGTLSSGIDLWLKRVSYPVIDKWYKKNLESAGYYHIDHGEGYDPYHVGGSRGVGGTGVMTGDSIYSSKNFTAYKTLAEGPIRTVFELTYAPWEAGGTTVTETKRISLDLGANLSRFEIAVSADKPLENYLTGITLHDKSGKVITNPSQGWLAYWEMIDSTALGTGILVNPEELKEIKDHRVGVADQSHLAAIFQPVKGKVAYYAGFGWEKSGQFTSRKEWTDYLEDFSKRMNNPLIVHFK